MVQDARLNIYLQAQGFAQVVIQNSVDFKHRSFPADCAVQGSHVN